ncbi:MAG: DUF1553 domain-containing protein [Gemmataceae bacterium]|jgi:hypothetical protein|nr:DUF1553 domain-containing protein [Gemmataceae bacterium]
MNALSLLATSFLLSAPPDFDSQIAPLLIQKCIGCHSGAKPKGDLDLTKKENVLTGSMPLIVPNQPKESLFWQKIVTDQMPPQKKLSDDEKKQLEAWILNGAKWGTNPISPLNRGEHWAYQPLKMPVIPKGQSGIDYLIQQKLTEKKLNFSPQASREILIRRLSFDLLGLPPTPEEVREFLNDTSPNAYEKLVDRFLASPRYGERWARHWLDVVHYGETHGYDKDKPRPYAYPYRDYVIRSFNQDKPYARFIQEQIAGDVLFPDTVDGIEALGFLAAGPWDFIGHVELPESKLDGKVARHLDRDDFVSNTIGTFLSTTIHCAQCHDHKFDPITQKEYYALQAIFAAIDRTEKSYDSDPTVYKKRQLLNQQEKDLRTQLQKLEQEARRAAGPALIELEQKLVQAQKPPQKLAPEYGYHSQIVAKAQTTKWVQVDLEKQEKIDQIILRPCYDDYKNIGAGFGFPIRFRVDISDDPAFNTSQLVADHTDKDFPNPGTTPVQIKVQGHSARYVRVTAYQLRLRDNDYHFSLAELEVLDAQGKNLAAKKPVQALDSIEAIPRWRKSNLTDGIYPAPSLGKDELTQLQKAVEKLLESSLNQEARNLRRQTLAELERIAQEQSKLPNTQKVAYIGAIHTGTGNFVGTGPSGGKPRPIYLLPRGDVSNPREEIGPGVLALVPVKANLESNSSDSQRRAALAKWLSHEENPLVWRSIVNRIWQYHFGRGIVETANDFGRMGSPPTHPALLDYLAITFRDGGGSFKQLHKAIVMSRTYQQVSDSRPEMEAIDKDNRYLWRQSRRKLEAEAIRDSLLAVAGKLDLTMGGPSFQDFVIEKPEHSPHYQYHLYDPEDTKTHRRSIYRFVVRSKQQPFLATFDCADPSLAVDRRNETITPLQALALLNNKLSLTMAKYFAERVRKSTQNENEQVETAFQLALARKPNAREAEILKEHLNRHGLENLCRLILNLNEFIFID